MLSDIVSLALSILGIVFLLFVFMFRLMEWQEPGFTLAVPLRKADEDIFSRLSNLRSLCEFLGIHKKTTVVLINYGVPEWFIIKLKSHFSDDFIRIASSTEELFKE